MPKWAEELQEADLTTVLTKDSKAGEKGLREQAMWWQKQSNNNSELPLAFYQKWKVNDHVISYASLKPRVEPRLQEIYRKFASKLTEYEHELAANFNVNGKFQPAKVRDDLVEKKQRADRAARLREDVEREISEVYAKQEVDTLGAD